MKNLHWIFFLLGSLVFLLPPFPEFGHWRILITSLAILFGAMILLPIYPLKPKVRLLDAVLATFVISQFLSSFWAFHPSLVWQKGMYWLLLFLLYLVARNVNLKDFDLRRCGIVFVLVNMLNYIFLFGVYYQILETKGTGARLAYEDINQLMWYYATNGNYIGSLMVILFPFYFHLLEKKELPRYLLYPMMIIHIVLLFSFNSKAVLVALGLSTAYILWSKKNWSFYRSGMIILSIALAVSVGAIYLIVENPSRFLYTMGPGQTITGKTSDERLAIWEQSLQLFMENPILGAGAGNWPVQFLKYGISHFHNSFDSLRFYQHAHNLFFETLGELGLLGGVCLIFIFFYPFWLLVKFSRDETLQSVIPYVLCFIVVSSFYGVAYNALGNFQPAQFIWVFVIGLLPPTLQSSLTELRYHKLPEKFLVWAGAGTLLWAIFVLTKINDIKAAQDLVRKQKNDLALIKFEEIYHPQIFRYYHGTPLMTNIAQIHWRLGERDAAIKNVRLAISDSPYNPIDWIHLANMSRAIGDLPTAKTAYQKVSYINNTYFPAQIALAQIALREKDWDAFDKNLAFYERDILPGKEKHYSEAVWESDNEAIQNYWKKMCGYEDVVIDLREKKRILISGQ